MKDSTDIINIYNIYQEGIFDRVGARIGGIKDLKFFGGRGYNAGKAATFKNKLYERIVKDIDKFLDEVQTMGDIKSLADFETKYPEIANKIACMADAVGHRTGLTVGCKRNKETPPPPPPAPAPKPLPFKPKPVEPGPRPVEPRQRRWACRHDGACYPRRDGKYASREECEKNCKERSNDDRRRNDGDRRRGGGGGSQIQQVGRDNLGNMINVQGQGNRVVINVFNRDVREGLRQGKSTEAAVATALKKQKVKPTQKNIEKGKRMYYRNAKGQFTKKPTA